MAVLSAKTPYVKMKKSRLRKASYDSARGLLLRTVVLGLGNIGVVSQVGNFRTCAINFLLAQMNMISTCLMVTMTMIQAVLRINPNCKKKFDASSLKALLTPKIGMV